MLGASAQYFPAGGLANPNLPIRRITSSVYLKDTLMVSLTRGKFLGKLLAGMAANRARPPRGKTTFGEAEDVQRL
jgi:hypothetical protein